MFSSCKRCYWKTFVIILSGKIKVCKIQITLLNAPEPLMPNDSLKVQSDSIDTKRCHVCSALKAVLGFRSIEVLLSGETAIFKIWMCEDIHYTNAINFQLPLSPALASFETRTKLNMLARIRMRQTSEECESRLHFWESLDNLKLYCIVLLVQTR